MPIIIKCRHCGFIFYAGYQLRSIDDVLKLYGYRCPCCMSPILDEDLKKINVKVSPLKSRERYYVIEKIKGYEKGIVAIIEKIDDDNYVAVFKESSLSVTHIHACSLDEIVKEVLSHLKMLKVGSSFNIVKIM